MAPPDQFEAIVADYYEPLFRFALSLTQAESDARDLTQHTFLVWARKGHELRNPSKVKCWLFTTLHRAFLEARRRQVRFPHHELEQVAEQLPIISPDLANRLDSAQVLTALAKVGEIFQAAIALFYLEDYSYNDIAAILDLPIGTVRSRLARGIAQLRKILLSDDSPAGRKAAHPSGAMGKQAPDALTSHNVFRKPGNTEGECVRCKVQDIRRTVHIRSIAPLG